MKAPGWNKLNWDCERDGCFNKLKRPKIEVFASCFPRRINFGDVDGFVEISGWACFLEWKGNGASLRHAQDWAYRAITKQSRNVVFVAEGDPETMEVSRYRIYQNGEPHDWVDAGLDRLKVQIKRWADAVDGSNRVKNDA